MALWVSLTEFEAYLVAHGVLKNPVGENDPAGFLPLQDILEASQSEFERRVGWSPFLCESAASPRLFDAELFPCLDLLGGAWNLVSVTVSGTPITLGTNVYGYPQNANLRGFPVTTLQFISRWGFPSSSWVGKQRIEVTAQWGRVLTLPSDVKMAILQYSAGAMVPILTYARTGGAQKLKEGDEEIDFGGIGGFGGGGAGSFSSIMTGAFDHAVMRWKRVGLA